jgi:hypothetical protein
MVIAGPEKAEDNKVNNVKQTIDTQKFGCIVAMPISGTAAALPRIQIQAFVRNEFFSYLSAITPPMIPEASPTTDRITELTNEYWILYFAKHFKKNTGR